MDFRKWLNHLFDISHSNALHSMKIEEMARSFFSKIRELCDFLNGAGLKVWCSKKLKKTFLR